MRVEVEVREHDFFVDYDIAGTWSKLSDLTIEDFQYLAFEISIHTDGSHAAVETVTQAAEVEYEYKVGRPSWRQAKIVKANLKVYFAPGNGTGQFNKVTCRIAGAEIDLTESFVTTVYKGPADTLAITVPIDVDEKGRLSLHSGSR